MTKPISMTVAIAILLISASASAQEEHPCQSSVAQILASYGLSLAETEVFAWRQDNFASGRHEQGAIDDYTFYGRPASCKGGEIAIELDPECRVEDVYSHGDCRIKGIPHYWW